MIDPDADFPEQPDYKDGYDWAVLHAPEIAELHSSTNGSAPELRSRLFKVAGSLHPSVRGEMENELRQTLFVMGAMKRVVQKLQGIAGFAELFEISMEIGHLWGAERWKYKCFTELRGKDAGWWRRRMGAASPNDIVAAFSHFWWRQYAKEKGVSKTSKWEVLVDVCGTRELCIFAHLANVELEEHQGGRYKVWTVQGTKNEFQMLASPVWDTVDGRQRLIHGAGEIVG